MALNINVGGTWKEPTACSVNVGGTWKKAGIVYTNVSGTWKRIFLAPRTWSTMNNVLQPRASAGGAGAATASLTFGGDAMGGYTGGIYGTYSNTEKFNGTSWASDNSLPRVTGFHAGVGLQNAALCAGGNSKGFDQDPGAGYTTYPYTVHYNGTSWSGANNMVEAIEGAYSFGRQNAAYVCKGVNKASYVPPSSHQCYDECSGTYYTVDDPGYYTDGRSNNAYNYNGTSWAVAGSNPGWYYGRYFGVTSGLQNAGIAAGGIYTTSYTSTWQNFQIYNGSTWSSPCTVPASPMHSQLAGGTDDAVLFQGRQNYSGYYYTNGSTFMYNGTSWATGPSASYARTHGTGVGFLYAYMGCYGSSNDTYPGQYATEKLS